MCDNNFSFIYLSVNTLFFYLRLYVNVLRLVFKI